MFLNFLGFPDIHLYISSQFFEGLPIERLVGPGVCASDLNDDVLGRTLDEIHGADPTQLFMKLALRQCSIL
jgi:transposase